MAQTTRHLFRNTLMHLLKFFMIIFNLEVEAAEDDRVEEFTELRMKKKTRNILFPSINTSSSPTRAIRYVLCLWIGTVHEWGHDEISDWLLLAAMKRVDELRQNQSLLCDLTHVIFFAMRYSSKQEHSAPRFITRLKVVFLQYFWR